MDLPAEEAAGALAEVPPDQLFEATFNYGEAAAARLGLEAAVRRGNLLPRQLQIDYFDGAAHGWSPSLSTPPQEIARQIETLVPLSARERFHEGVMMSWTIQLEGEAEKVVPTARSYAETVGRPLPLDGVRIGYQRARGDDLPAALDDVTDYPEDWQGALVEELGWRAGDDDQTWQGGLPAVIAATPERWRCHLVHGAVRGRVLSTGWSTPEEAARFVSEVDERLATVPACADAAWRGLSWGVHLRWGHQPGIDQQHARMLPDGHARDLVLAQLNMSNQPNRRTPWQVTEEELQRSSPGHRPRPGR